MSEIESKLKYSKSSGSWNTWAIQKSKYNNKIKFLGPTLYGNSFWPLFEIGEASRKKFKCKVIKALNLDTKYLAVENRPNGKSNEILSLMWHRHI